MIVYNVIEEVRILIYLIVLGIFIPTSYDLITVIRLKKKVTNVIIKMLGSILIIIISYYFIYKLKEGYVPQYGVLIMLLGIGLYYGLIRRKFMLKVNQIKKILLWFFQKIKFIIKPLTIFKTTFCLIKQKSKNLYIKILYKRKKM